MMRRALLVAVLAIAFPVAALAQPAPVPGVDLGSRVKAEFGEMWLRAMQAEAMRDALRAQLEAAQAKLKALQDNEKPKNQSEPEK